MKKFLLTLLTSIFLLSAFAAAQTPTIVAFVRPSALLAEHPAGQEAQALAQQRDEELAPLVQELQTLQAKAQTAAGLTPEERERANVLLTTTREVQRRYDLDIQNATAPALESINASIAAVAQENGYNLVLDGQAAGSGNFGLGLVVYAENIPDITDQVIAHLRAQ